MYSLKYGESDKKAAKGVKKYVIRDQLKHDSYKECLFRNEVQRHSMNMIRSDHHNLYTVTQCKRTLSSYDDKRHLLDDGISSLAYGHYKIIN
jgi:hypothetical protein